MKTSDAAGREGIRTGLVGRGIAASRSPWLHEQEAAAAGLALTYELFDFTQRGWDDAELPALFERLAAAGFAAVNVTFPFKQAAVAMIDELSPAAQAIGAVNTVAFRQGRRIGHNTDVTGFAASFRAGLPQAALGRVLQLGCGGAGSATGEALLGMLGAGHLVLCDNDAERAGALHAQLAARHGEVRVSIVPDAQSAAATADGIVNATPVGMAKFPGLPIAAEAISPRHWVADIVYFPLETALLVEARARGCVTLDGGGMAVYQAAEAFEIFTGRSADSARMRASFGRFSAAG